MRAANPKHHGGQWHHDGSPVKRGSRTRVSYKTMSSAAGDSVSQLRTAIKMAKIILFIIACTLSLVFSAPAEKAQDLAPSEKEDLQTAASHYGHFGGYGWGGYGYGGHYGYPHYGYYGYPGYGYGGLYGGFPYGGYGHGYWW